MKKNLFGCLIAVLFSTINFSSLAQAVDLSAKLSDVSVQNKLPSISVPCKEVVRSLIRSYENSAPDEMFMKRYADILCRCGESIEENQYQVIEPSPQCLHQLGQCYQKIVPQVMEALEQCHHEGNSWEECKQLSFDEVVPERSSEDFLESYQAIQRTCQ